MNLQQLQTFCTVISEGSMTAAAEKLFLTQPAVSQQIRSLEDELKVPLLVRGVRQIKPTIQGQLLFDYAKRILYLTNQAEVAIQTMSQEISGTVRIGTLNWIGMYLISPIIGILLKHNPNLSIKLDYGPAADLISKLKSGGCDIAILPEVSSEYKVNLDGFDEQFVFKDEMWLVASGRDTSVPSTLELKNITVKPVVYFTDMYPGFKRLMDERFREQSLNVKPVFETDSVGTLKRVIESGLGWGFLPSHSIKKQVRSGRMIQIQTDEIKYSVNIKLYSGRVEGMRQKADVLFRAMSQQGSMQ